MELETLKVCIDGVDCSGKTTLWTKLHKASDYRWKLEDRSFVTMVVYARLHGRTKALDYERQLMNDLGNLNNKYILIDPPWSTIEERFYSRGDDLHDFNAMVKIHAIYRDVINQISRFPNVFVLDGTLPLEIAVQKVNSWLEFQDSSDIERLIRLVQDRAKFAPNGEVSPMRFSFIEDGTFPQLDEKILDANYVSERYPAVKPATVVEFNKMVHEFTETIGNELKGENMYNLPQGLESRRFVFAQEACVSFIQAMVRDGMFKFYATFRSTHVNDVFPADIRLLYLMAQRAHTMLDLPASTRAHFEIVLHSAHTIA